MALVLWALRAAPAGAEASACLSGDPSQWPASSKPYFLVVVDTSGSMGTAVTDGINSCGYQHNRIGDARCAVRNIVNAYAGVVNFGLLTYAWKLSCPNGSYTCLDCDMASGCFTNAGCSFFTPPADNNHCGPVATDANLDAALNESSPGTKNLHAGGVVAVPLAQDNYWDPPLTASNIFSILNSVDNDCGNGEVGAYSNTPLGGALYVANQYLAGTYRDPYAADYPSNTPLSSPIGPATFNGQPAERTCRSINVILISDGDETCDFYNGGSFPNHEGLAVFEAGMLFKSGVKVSGQVFPVKTYTVGFIGATVAALDNIASAGGTVKSYNANGEAQLFQALSNIVAGAIKPETCDNADNNCNGCTDEGFSHYADVGMPCCGWATEVQRTACLISYQASITAGNPKGNQALLPCTTAAQSAKPATWLCYDPGEKCDNVDNNGDGRIDEGIAKCGSPAHCPQTEVCNGVDDDCNGVIDDGNVCGSCSAAPHAEICDGCDNDCNGSADDGVFAPVPCGPSGPGEPPNCQGTRSCKPAQVVAPGACVAGGGYAACAMNPQPEICDGLDNDCNGIVDDNMTSAPCMPTGAPPGLVYGGTSQCQLGQSRCVAGTTSCSGSVAPSAEVCDGVDNDCDGIVDNAPAGVGQPCGRTLGVCQPGTASCVNGALICTGGVQPQTEVCDGIDNDCDGVVDGEGICGGGLVCREGKCASP